MALIALPDELILSLPDYLSNIEDFIYLSSACSRLRSVLNRTLPNRILRLAVAQSRTFFRPSPWFLVAATARELGDWARSSAANEDALALAFRPLRHTFDAVLNLAVQHCGLTMQRIRELYHMRTEVMNPVADRMDDLYAYMTPFDDTDRGEDGNNDVSSHGTLYTDDEESFLLFAIYGELFGRDLDAVLHPDDPIASRRLSVRTRLEYAKYCCPGWTLTVFEHPDPDVRILGSGQWGDGGYTVLSPRYNVFWALLWIQKSRRWRRHWRDICDAAGCDLAVRDDLQKWETVNWRRKLWLNVLVVQGFQGFEMISSAIPIDERVRRWGSKLREWSRTIAALEEEPPRMPIGRTEVLQIPCFLEDLDAVMELKPPK